MSFSKKIRQRLAVAGAVGTLVTAAGVTAVATPAAAAPATTAATATDPITVLAGVFIYAQPNYSIPVYPSGAPTYVSDLSGPARDTTSSISNSTNLSMCFYEHSAHRGLEFRIGPGENWATIPSWIDNKISSYRPC
ncbi:hypothetical protein [Streptomyces yaizuensis]|uniref:Peptidase inhibitor family I36 protein n=1 Tax=Streptomyces yaizuensis TaxID=2989713 RepID=A0ABQ5NRG3_9ACTN|nr:hypothetical protein [Streptomyces sp. YSPA8]GLF92958.1 peptidase inhibitor family I36 protein [Streptomyces sp. YSPA8]